MSSNTVYRTTSGPNMYHTTGD